MLKFQQEYIHCTKKKWGGCLHPPTPNQGEQKMTTSFLCKLTCQFTLKTPYCQLCVHWRNLKKVNGRKFCQHQNKFVEKDTEACKDLEIYEMFWCYKNGQYRSIRSCLMRQDPELDSSSHIYEAGCRKCKQGKVVQNAWKRSKINKVKRLRKRRDK